MITLKDIQVLTWTYEQDLHRQRTGKVSMGAARNQTTVWAKVQVCGVINFICEHELARTPGLLDECREQAKRQVLRQVYGDLINPLNQLRRDVMSNLHMAHPEQLRIITEEFNKLMEMIAGES